MRKWLFRVAVVLVALGALFRFSDKFRRATLVLVGRSGPCTLAQAIAIGDHFQKETAIKDRILAASKQIATDGPFEQWSTPHGDFWIPKGSQYVLPFNLAEQELEIYGVGDQAIKPGDIVLDCGANVGVFTRMALKKGAAKVVAIEPAPENVECLKRNFAAEIADGRVVVYPKGVWDKDDVLKLRIDPQNSAADSFVLKTDAMTETVDVPLTTIDKLAEELALAKVDYIKFDIEGAEPNALRGAVGVLKKFKPRLSVSAYHANDHPVLIPQIIREQQPAYRMECGPCNEVRDAYQVRPEILYFR
jgi:FkbM family methyltransferase